MNSRTVLVVSTDKSSLEIIESELKDANIRYCLCSNSVEGWDIVRTNPDIKSVVISIYGIEGCDLARRIRQVKSHDSLSILMIVPEEQIDAAGKSFDAGATDVLIDPFEAREFRMRMNIRSISQRRRVDDSHSVSRPENEEAEGSEHRSVSDMPPVTSVQMVSPVFDPASLHFAWGVPQEQVEAWRNDESVVKLDLDEVLVCPCCGSLPSFRYGCGTCGSAATEPESLIHHYACAHIASETEFQKGRTVRCPKCRKAELVAGSDFEVVPGGHACRECRAKISQPELIAHCLACQHRFPATDAAVQQLTAFRVSRVHDDSTSVGQQFLPAMRRPVRRREAGMV